MWMDVEFGRPARSLWSLQEDARFLNHGSFGACPLVVQGEQDRIRAEMERQPDEFIYANVTPKAEAVTPLRTVAGQIGEFVGVAGDSIAIIENATIGIQSVLNSLALTPGDEVLITDHQYNAVRLAVEFRCREIGAAPRVAAIPLPASADEVRASIREAAGPRVRLAIIDHITSPTALVFPIAEIIADLHERGVRVLVDGAHAIGHIPLDLGDLGADWYVSNLHKWLYAPKGSALLYASNRAREITRPAITSHFVEMGFPKAFDYLGTRDYSGWLAIPTAIAFFNRLGRERLWRHNARLIAVVSEQLERLGARPAGPPEMCAAMRAFILPQRREARQEDALDLKRALWEEARIQVNTATLAGALLIRISAQAYVDEADMLALGAQLERSGWPGRG
ncbi:MAG TPA: aminotransferase class V-fold PLP-dependent enzyme [Caulobacteraceae bacterium]|jgi:isopenicillin-N epimerase